MSVSPVSNLKFLTNLEILYMPFQLNIKIFFLIRVLNQ